MIRPRGRAAKLGAALLAALATLAIALLHERLPYPVGSGPLVPGPAAGADEARTAFEARAFDRPLVVEGRVERVLPDDREGSRHQRFIVSLGDGLTILVAHNIDLAPRVPIDVGDRVLVDGVYEWNERGGVLHWTHHDPRGERRGGKIVHEGRTYR